MQKQPPAFVPLSPWEKAVRFMETAEAKDGVNYDAATAYAKDLWAEKVKIFDAVDSKADGVIRYLGGGVALFTLGVLAKVDHDNYLVALAAVPAVLCAVVAVGLASFARRPTDVPALPTVEAVKACVDHYEDEDKAKGALLGQWHLACEGMRLVGCAKAYWLEWAVKFYCAAIVLLVFPLGVAILMNVR